MSERVRVYISYFLICTIWGSTWLVIKIGLQTLTPLFAAGCRFIVASTLLFILIKIRGVNVPLRRKDWSFYLLVAFTSFGIPFGLVYWGKNSSHPVSHRSSFPFIPSLLHFFRFFFFRAKKLPCRKLPESVLGFLGVVVIFSNDVQTSDPRALWGMGAVFLSAVLQGYSVIVVKKHGHEVHPFVITFVPMLIGACMLLTASLLLEDLSAIRITAPAILSVFYLGMFGSVATFVSYFWLLKRVEAVVLSLSSFITPIIAVILGVVVLDEQMSQRIFLGAAFVLIGIVIANFVDLGKFVRKNLIPVK